MKQIETDVVVDADVVAGVTLETRSVAVDLGVGNMFSLIYC